ncbi:MAG: hypothetical protein J7647_01605 [Cyanobacteria bacterium SBLK]|nr:hypothetical protein [Cyanobacteria bacterium SBLK]
MAQTTLFPELVPRDISENIPRREKINLMIERLRNCSIPKNAPLVFSFGCGVNSIALLCWAVAHKIKIDAIFFADTGNEKPLTYHWLDKINQWIADNNQDLTATIPLIETVRYQLKPITKRRRKGVLAKCNPKYWKKWDFFVLELLLVIFQDARQFIRYTTLGENCLITETMPSKAYGKGSCSHKWKITPIHKAIARRFPNAPDIRQWIGIHAGEPQRLLMANGTPKPLIEDLNKNQRLFVEYPLVINNLNQQACQRLCLSVFGEIPPKSSCWFCPSQRIAEVRELKETYPDLFKAGCFLEINAMANLKEGGTKGLGRNFAWNDIDALTPLELAAIEAEKSNRSCNCLE